MSSSLLSDSINRDDSAEYDRLEELLLKKFFYHTIPLPVRGTLPYRALNASLRRAVARSLLHSAFTSDDIVADVVRFFVVDFSGTGPNKLSLAFAHVRAKTRAYVKRITAMKRARDRPSSDDDAATQTARENLADELSSSIFRQPEFTVFVMRSAQQDIAMAESEEHILSLQTMPQRIAAVKAMLKSAGLNSGKDEVGFFMNTLRCALDKQSPTVTIEAVDSINIREVEEKRTRRFLREQPQVNHQTSKNSTGLDAVAWKGREHSLV